MNVQLPEPTRQRLLALYKQRQDFDAHISEVLLVALEAMGVEGKVIGCDLETGLLTFAAEDLNGTFGSQRETNG